MKCPDCNGEGVVTGLMSGECCGLCHGTGQIDRYPVCDHDDCPWHECRKHPVVKFWKTALSRGERLCFVVYTVFGGCVAAYMIGRILYRLWQDMQ